MRQNLGTILAMYSPADQTVEEFYRHQEALFFENAFGLCLLQ
jgi:hypothetical protein